MFYQKYEEDLAQIERAIKEILEDKRFGDVLIVIREGKIRTIKKTETEVRNS